MSLRTKVSASLSAVPKEPSGSCGVMATRRPPWAGTAPITLLVKAGVPAPARAAAMKVEAFINTPRSEEHTSELQSLMRISYAVFCLKKKTHQDNENRQHTH